MKEFPQIDTKSHCHNKRNGLKCIKNGPWSKILRNPLKVKPSDNYVYEVLCRLRTGKNDKSGYKYNKQMPFPTMTDLQPLRFNQHVEC